jgi:hypothetical protein
MIDYLVRKTKTYKSLTVELDALKKYLTQARKNADLNRAAYWDLLAKLGPKAGLANLATHNTRGGYLPSSFPMFCEHNGTRIETSRFVRSECDDDD